MAKFIDTVNLSEQCQKKKKRNKKSRTPCYTYSYVLEASSAKVTDQSIIYIYDASLLKSVSVSSTFTACQNMFRKHQIKVAPKLCICFGCSVKNESHLLLLMLFTMLSLPGVVPNFLTLIFTSTAGEGSYRQNL